MRHHTASGPTHYTHPPLVIEAHYSMFVFCRLPDASSTVATLWETSAGVNSLSLEDPCLSAALTDGTVVLLNTEAAMKQRQHGRTAAQSPMSKRLFQLPTGAALCADLADQWLVAGAGKSCSQRVAVVQHCIQF